MAWLCAHHVYAIIIIIITMLGQTKMYIIVERVYEIISRDFTNVKYLEYSSVKPLLIQIQSR